MLAQRVTRGVRTGPGRPDRDGRGVVDHLGGLLKHMALCEDDHFGRYTTAGGQSPNLRRILIDMIEEYARHAGHADLIRESVDGLVGEDPPAAGG